MGSEANTLFLRLEGPIQSWGDNSRFVIRRSADAPTKSGVLGLLCCAMGLRRQEADAALLELRQLRMAVRIDRQGTPWWDYHTIGARSGTMDATGTIKYIPRTKKCETLISRREYVSDASYLVALKGEPGLIARLACHVKKPRWPIYLGRKSCPPCVPPFALPCPGESWTNPAYFRELSLALSDVPWHARLNGIDPFPPEAEVPYLSEWRPSDNEPLAPPDAEVWYDNPVSFAPPVHEARLVTRGLIHVDVGSPSQGRTPAPPRPRADYRNHEYRRRRSNRLENDRGLCVFCKAPATTVQHITYRRAGGNEALDDLRSLCRLCHDAVTMIEYGVGMGLDRINPEDARWRSAIIEKRQQIIEHRSLETRRRRLSPEEVE